VTATVVAHFSDPHLAFEPRLTVAQRFSKRQLSVWSWARHRAQSQQNTLLGALVADIHARAPDEIVVTGDIANFSLPDEFPAAARWLEQLGPREHVSLVPGNHDALVPVAGDQGLGHWRPWMSSDDGSATWPYSRVRGSLALVGVNSALPTPPFLASGRVGATQLDALEHRLQDLGARGLCRVVLIHHPPAAGAISRRKALDDAAALRAVIERVGAELVLHGHARDARFDRLRGPAGFLPCLGLPSASAVPSARDAGSRWQCLNVVPDGEAWRLEQEVRLWSPQQAAFVSAGCFIFRLRRQVPAGRG
jgi:3',5'-cyclic AMP phosphodiesterase CpdA